MAHTLDTVLETNEEDGDCPEICYGYLRKELDPGRWMKLFFTLENGELFAFNSETAPGSRIGEKLLDTMDLDGWAIAFPTAVTILLSPPTANNVQVLLEESNGREYNKWTTAFNEHINYMNFVTGRVIEIAAAAVPATPPVVEVKKPEPVAVKKLAPPPEPETEQEYTDKRGIRMSIRVDNKSRYAEQTLQILRDQLIKDGKMPLEFIPLPELKAEMSAIFEKANNGVEYDEARLDYLLKCMDLNPEYKAEKEKETAAWRAIIGPYTQECLRTMRGFVPPHIFNSTLQSLTLVDKMPTDIAKRIIAKKCLWLVRISTSDISKMHIAELTGRFNPEAQGLDVVELAAIFAMIPEKFNNDDAKGSKEKWRLSIEECLKSFYTQNKNGTLAKLKQRNPAYKNLEPFFTQEEVYHSMHVTLGSEAFNPRASFRLINKRQSVTRKSAVGPGLAAAAAAATTGAPSGGIPVAGRKSVVIHTEF
jgi:hypothetical protein